MTADGSNGSNNKWIGKRTLRPDGEDKVTGRAAFGADFSQPGMLWGKVLRSPHPHARIKSINFAKATALPGVKAVMTGKDLVEFPWDKPAPLGIQDLRFNSRNVMARDKALYAGHAVAAVAATSSNIASRALKLIEVDYEVLPWVIDVDEALQPGAPILHEHMAQGRRQAGSGDDIECRGHARAQAGQRRGRVRCCRCRRRAQLQDQAGASRLYRAARLPRERHARTVTRPSGAAARATSWCAT